MVNQNDALRGKVNSNNLKSFKLLILLSNRLTYTVTTDPYFLLN